MKSRIFIAALLIAVGFLWSTAHSRWNLQGILHPFLRAGASWSEPTRVYGAGLSSDEQNNINIYKSARLATVYITSTTVRRDFFFQPVASNSIGSGFLINSSGFILTNYHVISGSSRLQVTLFDQDPT